MDFISRKFDQVVQDSSTKWFSQHWDKPIVNPVCHLGFLEIPFDYAVSYRPGTRFGPQKIIANLNEQSLFCTDKRSRLEDIAIKHFGIVDILHSLPKTYQNIKNAIDKIPHPFIPVCLGGDHSISDPILRSMIEKHGNHFGLVIFDAHFDSREPIKDKEHSGHWVKTLENVLNYQNVIQLGINASIYSDSYLITAEKNGILVKTPFEIRHSGLMNTVQEIKNHLTDIQKIYISVDIDVIDQAFAPGTSVPNPCGLFPYEVADLLFALASGYSIIGFDITEVSPPLDINEITSKVAAQFILNFMAGIHQFYKET
jgi:agmatinase